MLINKFSFIKFSLFWFVEEIGCLLLCVSLCCSLNSAPCICNKVILKLIFRRVRFSCWRVTRQVKRFGLGKITVSRTKVKKFYFCFIWVWAQVTLTMCENSTIMQNIKSGSLHLINRWQSQTIYLLQKKDRQNIIPTLWYENYKWSRKL